MIKKFLPLILAVLIATSAFSQSKDFSKWSITGEYGYNKFDGDINQDLLNIIPTSVQDITYGATVEYALTPIWGLSLDYYFFPLRAINNTPAANISTNLYTSDINATINFTRFIFPQTKSKIYINGTIGAGLAYYKYNVTNSETALLDDSIGVAASIPVTFSVEYNFSKPLAIGVKLHYRAYTKDNIEGVKRLNWDGVTNDFIAAGTLFLRYKFQSIKKHHLRNINMEQYTPNPALELAKANADKINKLDTALHNLEKKVDKQGGRLDSVVGLLSNDGPDTDGDGVPDHRDMASNTPSNTPVDFWGKAIPLPECITTSSTISNASSTGLVDDIPAVYFDFDQIELDNDALVTISKIAKKMKANPGLMVEVRGYCDYMGNNPYNELLSQRRSDRVKAELVKVWGIGFDRIIPNGKGKVIEPRSKYRPNRRCDFFFSK